jgi:putative membrane protein insertion efficiency factor
VYGILTFVLLTQAPLETNPVILVASTGFRLYQTMISPSQGDVCNFNPSCSHFATESIEKYGIFWGSFMASDRLLRCNPWALDYFDTYYEGIRDYKIYDPVRNNYIFSAIHKEQTFRAEYLRMLKTRDHR